MNLSMKWLSDYVDITATPREYAEALTMSGSKVEGYEIEGSEIENVVVGKVLSIDKHPDADKLVICQVEVGQASPVQIVTGATNVTVGALVPVCLDGAVLPGGKKIKKGKLRGVLSEGMLCSLGELGLTVNDFPYAIEDGIFLIEENCEVGQDIQSAIALNDTSVEFEITSNRPDCLSVIGLARETAATFDVPLRLHTPQVKGSNDGDDIKNYLKVAVEATDLCPRYTAKIVKDVKIEPSPLWMRERLRASGVRPINNLVDITNYVMLEYGQPMHAFDLRYVAGNEIVVRRAKNGETMMTLDGVDRTFTEDMLIISDAEKPVAVAGVMGGEYSGIMEDTKTVVFESANFLGNSVRRTAKKLGMRTDASARYEKGISPLSTMECVERACELVEMLGAGTVVDGVIDVDHSDKTPKTVKLEPDWINRFLGISLSRDEMVKTLEALGFTMDGDQIVVPYFRIDIEHKADIAEEIARIYGYNKIPTTAPTGTARGVITPRQKFERTINETMLSLGCYEIMTYSFISPKYYDNILLPADSELRDSVTIMNPLGEDTSIMRTTTIPSMMEIVSRNYNNRNPYLWAYEIGMEYIPAEDKDLPDENPMLTIGLYGNDADFYTLKGMVETVLDRIGAAEVDVDPCTDDPTFHPGRCAVLSKDGGKIGVLGEISPRVCQNYDVGAKVYVAKLDVNALFEISDSEKTYRPLPKYPATSRDLSLICDDELPIVQIERAIKGAVGKILEKVELFDVYRGAQVEKDKKSVSYSIVMRSDQGTLTDEEADGAVKRVLKALDKIGVSLRQ
ncbi:Phenylalanine--tRNA ligase beta subunit [uncultured Ruminococcus sp.]|uniref:phenylalanine--tRNA ligase subunit beta n=1 Tax=Massiliimalia timonensis TaxID=1987501 RepID=UPI000822D92E|nr:phenylalanine--tRNA ligase subunit beta [Massiliimalia timonensis]SCH13560.1 Phenylalanine--tRNA ligase beta subunit [uncultured Ruminococcus sp.]SCH80738.1 Phenylalanine--tRNA ligase beta subunit [uncultured Clostridium sp.]